MQNKANMTKQKIMCKNYGNYTEGNKQFKTQWRNFLTMLLIPIFRFSICVYRGVVHVP